MSMLFRLRNQTLRWWHDVPLPAGEADATPIFQPWYSFDSSTNNWVSIDSTSRNPSPSHNSNTSENFIIVTWNVDASSPAPEARISALISHIQSLAPPPDIIFLQEVSRPALSCLLETPWLREHWFSSESDTTSWGTQSFANMTLVSRSRFTDPAIATLSPLWRIKYPSRFDRDALCFDLVFPSAAGTAPRVRLVNVHLDSLPINPSLRPRQLAIVASYLRAAGRGLVAGDFNPVLPDDEALVHASGLLDVWRELRPRENGFTWGVDGDQPFPANRLDKVAVVGLTPCDIKILAPGGIEQADTLELEREGENDMHDRSSILKWSDHSGLVCSLAV
ncbi:Endonuclease/Exonuclease/phosphatase family protein [Aspergillus steynii IBT 23096]|uniref:Endonuclease/Exonuclease/phosphatase family protein n=1 Tax=Aspergillus steynii IBT 23096 TaxID=1392250 RepID=A0A2I2GB95_9EURO|nr:Endonuclease/Exonuclease/phosphatase family protein [Aspergillus steynii IBT 23096]PLB50159.1 Endonuclease/Exonuclease/phosphatase family protein [Aspergillus steynii IBT 23096]